jgi:hypothetical protein
MAAARMTAYDADGQEHAGMNLDIDPVMLVFYDDSLEAAFQDNQRTVS